MSRVLIDTQALIWFAEDATRLSARAIEAVDDSAAERMASVGSLWEMAIKIGLGKLTLKTGTLSDFVALFPANQIQTLPITIDDALAVSKLPQGPHKDPFDRIIAAQCLLHDLTLVSIDEAFDNYGVRRIW